MLGYLDLFLLFVVSAETLSLSKPHSQRDRDNSTRAYKTRFTDVTWDNDRWQLATTRLEQGRFQSRMTVANGYHGISVAALGPFFEVDDPASGESTSGWPLFSRRQAFATIGGFWTSQPRTNGTNFPWLYQYGWDSTIAGIPHWGGIVVVLGPGKVLDASTDNRTISNFYSMLDMRQGLLSWSLRWAPERHTVFDVTYQMFAHKVQINQGFVKMTIRSCTDSNMTVVNILDGVGAVRTNASDKGTDGDFIFSGVKPWGVDNVTAYVYAGMTTSGAQVLATDLPWITPDVSSNESSIASAVNVTLRAGQMATFIKYVGVASTDVFSDPLQIARTAALSGRQAGYRDSRQSHIQEWAAVLPRSTVDDFAHPENGSLPQDPYIIEAAITAVANTYHILQNTISRNASVCVATTAINEHSIAVGGLGSDAYAGQIFWDADIWMHPGLAASFPFAARGITNYRRKLYPQALANAQTSYQSSKNQTAFSPEAAVYPWTSGRYGNCTGTGPCWDYQYHLNGDIVLAMTSQWLASGDEAFLQDTLSPISGSIATAYSELLQRNGSFWALANMTDPDEYANMVDNGGYTMPLIAKTLNAANYFREYLNQSQRTAWTSQAEEVVIGREPAADLTLEYTGPIQQNGSIAVKQADIVLITYPLSYFNENYTAQNSLNDLDYYANKQSADGPAMTWAIFSIVANEVSPAGCSAYTYQQYSYQPYVRPPWYQFSEQTVDDANINGGTNPAFPFLTGHGGSHQVVLYGYLGLRYSNNGFLNVDPAPPPQISSLRYRDFYWRGWPIAAYSNRTHTSFSRVKEHNPAHGTSPDPFFANTSIPVLVGSSANPDEQRKYLLSSDQSLVIPNRQYWKSRTIPDNIAQCQPLVYSESDYLPGQFPLSAFDGATSTRWQPRYANATASITVSLPVGFQITAMVFDWALEVPYNYSVILHNDREINASNSLDGPSRDDIVTISSLGTVIPLSNPYNKSDALLIRRIVGNTTTIYFNETVSSPGTEYTITGLNGSLPYATVYTAQYATLSIWGNQFNASYNASNMSGSGATVAEWAIIVTDIGDDDGY